MRTLKLTLAYDGTGYVGWQRQDNGRSIQGALEDALAEIEGRRVTVFGAGRTDAGVHALGQVASVRLRHEINAATLGRALNAKLPLAIRVTDVADAAPDFHARYAAYEKTYRYWLDTGAVASPFGLRYMWHVRAPLDLDAMRVAADELRGRRDFAAFQASGTAVDSTVRTLSAVTVETAPAVSPTGAGDGMPSRGITVEVAGDGFLRHMVRTIVGTLVEIGTGRRPPADMASIIASGRRDRAGPTAPARGLFLVRVDYEDP